MVFASIAVFQLTLQRHRIGWGHLIRIAALSWLGWLTATHLGGVIQYVAWAPPSFGYRPLSFPLWIRTALQYAALGLSLVSLALAFSRYLRLRGAWIAALAAMALTTVALVFVTITLRNSILRRRGGDSLNGLNAWIPGLMDLCVQVFLRA